LEKETKAAAKQLKAREMELNQLETMHSAVKAQLEERVADLGSKLARTKDALAKSEHRRALDAEGFTNDVTLLRKQLKAVDRKLHQTRLQSRLHDDERLEVVLKKVEPKGQHQLEEVRCVIHHC
jgi:septal ring factor EnvC (AmiA/AmiB activator)